MVSLPIVNRYTFKKIVLLIKEIKRTPFEGTGKPEPLKHQNVFKMAA